MICVFWLSMFYFLICPCYVFIYPPISCFFCLIPTSLLFVAHILLATPPLIHALSSVFSPATLPVMSQLFLLTWLRPALSHSPSCLRLIISHTPLYSCFTTHSLSDRRCLFSALFLCISSLLCCFHVLASCVASPVIFFRQSFSSHSNLIPLHVFTFISRLFLQTRRLCPHHLCYWSSQLLTFLCFAHQLQSCPALVSCLFHSPSPVSVPVSE